MKKLDVGIVLCLIVPSFLAFAESISAPSVEQRLEALEKEMDQTKAEGALRGTGAATVSAPSVDQRLEALEKEIQHMKAEGGGTGTGAVASAPSVEQRLEALEKKIHTMEAIEQSRPQAPSDGPGAWVLTPNVEVVLSGQYAHFSHNALHIPGFQTAPAGMRYAKGFSLQESAIRLSADVDNKVSGVLTLVVVNHNGDDAMAMEEAFLQTRALPWGAKLKAGRLLPIFGALNESHKHADDFVDRPLLYRAYLGDGVGDDGLQAAWVLPVGLSVELGGGVFRGRSFPASAQGHTPGLLTAYARIGSGPRQTHTWRLGAYSMYAKSPQGRAADGLAFNGHSHFANVDFQYAYAPSEKHQLALQGEYVFRHEKGTYALEEDGRVFAPVATKSSGLYVQAVYAFMHSCRLGYRYAFVRAPRTPPGFFNTSLDSGGHHPRMHSFMAEYNTSAFGRFRLQYNHSHTHAAPEHQLMAQYSVSFGAYDVH